MTDTNDRSDDLILRLRGLPREMVPPARVWDAVAAGIEQERPAPALQAVRLPRARRRWPAIAGFAAAASLALAVGLVSVLRPAPEAPVPDPALVQQAELIAGEYREALAALPARDLPSELEPAIAELDQSAVSILAAIRETPSADFLLGQLQRTYAQRLQLTRQAALGPAATWF